MMGSMTAMTIKPTTNARITIIAGSSTASARVVVVIIGLLATLVGPRVWAMLGFGQHKIAQTKCKEYYDNAKFWRTVTNKYPTSLEDMAAPLRPGEEDFVKIEQDPWGTVYYLEIDGNRIRVWSWGPDGQEGTDDDISYPEIKE